MERNQKQEIPLKRVWKCLCNLSRMVKDRKTWNQEWLCRNVYQLVRFADNSQFSRPAKFIRVYKPLYDSFCDSELFLVFRKYGKTMPSMYPFPWGLQEGQSCGWKLQYSSGQADEWAGCRVKVRILSLLLCLHHRPGSINPSSLQLRFFWLSAKGA